MCKCISGLNTHLISSYALFLMQTRHSAYCMLDTHLIQAKHSSQFIDTHPIYHASEALQCVRFHPKVTNRRTCEALKGRKKNPLNPGHNVRHTPHYTFKERPVFILEGLLLMMRMQVRNTMWM